MKRNIGNQLAQVSRARELIQVKEALLIEKALTSNSPSAILKAQKMLENIEPHQEVDRKSYLIDPNDFNRFLGYKHKPFSLTYTMLRRISYSVPIIRAIIMTRIDQIAAFCEPQSDKYSTGFIIRKKRKYGDSAADAKEPTKADKLKIEEYTEFFLNCGNVNNFENDDFDEFVRKIMNDALTFDQMTFEVVRNNKGLPAYFHATDASTMRVADTFSQNLNDDKDKVVRYLNRKKERGYYPSHCQIKDNVVEADFYPWELCFGIRNPTTSIYANGYGVSEIEILMNVITSMLWGDEYNRRFFSQGSAPKGFIKIKNGTNINSTRLSEFKQQWQAMMAGVYNSWKTPVLEGDIDWVDLQKNNRDMEFAKWQEYLIKLSCAIFRIDPAEINFPLGGESEQKAMFEGNNEARLKHSKDKGLYPLLKFLQRKLNKYIMSQLDPEYEFVFCGMEGVSIQDELDQDIKMMGAFMTIDEIRIRRGMKALGEERGGNIIANAIWMQNETAKQQQKMQEEQAAQQEGMMGGDDGMEGEIPDDFESGNEDAEMQNDEDPFAKALDSYMMSLK